MSDKAQIWLNSKDLDTEFISHVQSCILEHHGTRRFSSLESEIVCNADCARFCTRRGVLAGLAGNKLNLPLNELLEFYLGKLEEKYELVSLEQYLPFFEAEYKAVKKFLMNAHRNSI